MSASKKYKVKVRMYCLGTGDCFVIKFSKAGIDEFTMMIDCGSCQGTAKDFLPYIENLEAYAKDGIDLLIITHEHNDHVNGFEKCKDIFSKESFKIREAWFAWTENPEDPDDHAKELQAKRTKMKKALKNAITEIKVAGPAFLNSLKDDFFKIDMERSQDSFFRGLDSMAEINLSDEADDEGGGKALAGMTSIKKILKEKKTKTRYLDPGETVLLPKLPGLKFHILGPPYDRTAIFKDGKQGTDVFNKQLSMYESALAANAFLDINNSDIRDKDIPFSEEYIENIQKPSFASSLSSKSNDTISFSLSAIYNDPINNWRTIDTDWLNGAGSLALRLNSHINNTSLVIAIESEEAENVILLPGDAEYGSWESWYLIPKWLTKGKKGNSFAEDLISRTLFYKVGHHLSYNGTALDKGILKMANPDLAAMATLDRNRIAPGWKKTMPNVHLLEELIKRCNGKFFIMDESEINNAPSKNLDPATLGKSVYETGLLDDDTTTMYKQYNFDF